MRVYVSQTKKIKEPFLTSMELVFWWPNVRILSTFKYYLVIEYVRYTWLGFYAFSYKYLVITT